MADIASLGIRVTTQGVDKASADLDKLAVSGAAASKSTNDLNKSFTQGGGVAKPAREAAAALKQQSAAMSDLATSTAKSMRATQQTGALSRAVIRQQMADYGMLRSIIDGNIKQAAELGAAEAALDRLQARGAISTSELAAAFAALNKVTEKNTVANIANAASRRGMNSRTQYELGVLGGEIASGNISRVKRSIPALLNSMHLTEKVFSTTGLAIGGVAAVLGTFALALHDAEADTFSFNKALLTTGNYANKTAAQLSGMVDQVAAAANTTQGVAREAIQAVTASGEFTGKTFDMVVQSAAHMQEATGQSISDTIQKFEALAKSPVDALLKLNDTEHFLTESQLRRVQALVDEGRQQDAASEAARIYADRLDDIATAADAATPHLTAMWREAKQGASSAWQETKKFAEFLAASADAYRNMPWYKKAAGAIIPGFGMFAAMRAAQPVPDVNVAPVAGAIDSAKARADKQKEEDAARFKDQYLTREEQKKRAIAELDKLRAQYSDAEYKNLRKQIDLRFAAPKSGGGGIRSDPFQSLSGLVANAQAFASGVGNSSAENAQAKAIRQIAEAGGKLIASGHDVAKAQALVATGVAALNEGYKKQADILRSDNIAAINQYKASLDKQNAALQQSVDAQLAQITLGPKEAARMQQMAQLTRANAEALTDLQLQREKVRAKGGDTTVLDADIASLQKNMDQQVDIVKGGWREIDAAQADGMNGVHTAIQRFLDEQHDMAGQMDRFTTNFLGGFADAFAELRHGIGAAKDAFGNLIDSMLADALRFVANQAMSKFLASFGTGNATAVGTTAVGGGGFWSSLLGLFTGNAKGGVYQSRGLSAFSGQMVSQPTMFAFAHGMGLMGEAGPEAILPLRRNMRGKLGVELASAGGTSQRGPVNVNQTIMVQGKIDRRTSAQIAQDTARQQRIAQTRNG